MPSQSFLLRSLLLSFGLLAAAGASAADQDQLLEAINAYRGDVQSCAGQASQALPPLSPDQRQALVRRQRANGRRR